MTPEDKKALAILVDFMLPKLIASSTSVKNIQEVVAFSRRLQGIESGYTISAQDVKNLQEAYFEHFNGKEGISSARAVYALIEFEGDIEKYLDSITWKGIEE